VFLAMGDMAEFLWRKKGIRQGSMDVHIVSMDTAFQPLDL
jgi:hypothetical protein